MTAGRTLDDSPLASGAAGVAVPAMCGAGHGADCPACVAVEVTAGQAGDAVRELVRALATNSQMTLDMALSQAFTRGVEATVVSRRRWAWAG